MILKKKKLIGILSLILIISGIVGHFLPPTGILAIPLTISLMTGLIMFANYDFRIIIKSILSYLFIGLNDICIKLFAGGTHDMEGLGFINALLFVGLIPCFIMLIIGILSEKSSNNWIKFLSILIFPLLIFIHFIIFGNLGVPVN